MPFFGLQKIDPHQPASGYVKLVGWASRPSPPCQHIYLPRPQPPQRGFDDDPLGRHQNVVPKRGVARGPWPVKRTAKQPWVWWLGWFEPIQMKKIWHCIVKLGMISTPGWGVKHLKKRICKLAPSSFFDFFFTDPILFTGSLTSCLTWAIARRLYSLGQLFWAASFHMPPKVCHSETTTRTVCRPCCFGKILQRFTW